jgi:DNA (cytosine-5)-methyltransferase 1
MSKMTHGSLFSGIGGFDLASEWMGWENVFHCEWNEFGQKILKHYWPDAITYSDITKTDFSIHRGRIDILTGGFPCQPFSTAGKRKGKEDDRYLWPEMLRAVREIQPGWIVGENVYGIINQGRGLVFEEVCAQMENEGYEVQPYLLPACSVNAPHRRDRFWFVAYAGCSGYCNEFGQNRCEKKENKSKGDKWKRIRVQPEGNEHEAAITDPKCIGQQRQGRPKGCSNTETIKDWEASWTYSNDRWPTEQPLRGGNDGLSKELHEACLTAYGNAIVPQLAYQIFKAIEKYENNINHS